ncbi:sensor histidine kinase KdpD [Pedobacter sp. Hv1]|uniref:sensor histidine kinase n=1 Tax=Pedobacter sp. Hv1 TaxID=1740090 RepID=UPI0006D899E3|nr:HAMP domain-containing sensor histidine kinase [Pedobacter sp. Hv1]KQC01834.1 hypothetical protein AQF98_05580 [Pedobacter sp. Hv1]
MLSLFTYKTPANFANAFKEFYHVANLKQVRILSTVILAVTIFSRIIAIYYHDQVIKIERYAEYSLINWVQITGSLLFLTLSTFALNSIKWNKASKKALTILFILFVLVTSFAISYVVSTYNTKNTLTMFLIGIVAVSLFFMVERNEIILIAFFIIAIFLLGMVIPKITFQDKIMNLLAAVILGFILVCFSRYNYCFKSQHFVRLKQLEEKNLEIAHLNNQKGEILGFVAHDLRNPLNNIEALSGFLLLEDKDNSEAQMISNAAKQAKEIINDLIEAAKQDQPNLQTEKLDIGVLLLSIIQKWRANTKREFVFVPTTTEIFAQINSSKLERVIDNLISNGLKFSAENTPIEIKVNQLKSRIIITVTDFGIGIPAKLQEYIFNQFSKAGRRGLQGEKSIGLGLHIAKKIIEQHHGLLLMSSKENEGTTFTIQLPIA